MVRNEIDAYPCFHIMSEGNESIYVEYGIDALESARKLRSVARAYLVSKSAIYNPSYIANHKSILGDILGIVLEGQKDAFKSFSIRCAGSDSEEVRSIARYVADTYSLVEREEADLKIHIIKSDDVWEIGTQITPRPLSLRDYKVSHMSGAMDPTIAYAMNSLCALDTATSYLNIFSGSGTLMIEAVQSYSNLKNVLGFDNDKRHISLSIQNIQKAGLLTKVTVKEADIFNKPNFGTFDRITSDLPFGMLISKDEDLELLYQAFIRYCEGALAKDGVLAVYTSQYHTLESLLSQSRFTIIKSLELQFVTSVNAYLKAKIMVCKRKS